MISRHKKLGLMAVSALGIVLFAGCNETLRQFIIPVPKPTGNPSAVAQAVVLSTNPAGSGSTINIDVSGDSMAFTLATGSNPVFLGKASGRTFVINGNNGNNTISTYQAPFSLVAVPISFPTVNTITLPPSGPDIATTPVFVGVSSSSNVFLANQGSNNISVISGSLAETQAIPIPPSAAGTSPKPVAIAGNSSNSKIYVVNNATNDVTVISTTDNTILTRIAVGNHPIWGVMAANGVQVFIVNQGDKGCSTCIPVIPPIPGSVMVIDTNSDVVIPCTPGPACDPTTRAIAVGTTTTPLPNFAFYDTRLQRLYVTNTGEPTVSVIKADGINLGDTPPVLPGLLANITISSASGAPTSVVALSDGSKAYAAMGGCPSGTNHTTLVTNPAGGTSQLASCSGHEVAVIDAIALRQAGATIPVDAGAVSIDASADASRVYVVGAQAGSVSIIAPSSNNVTTKISVPQQDPSCTSSCPLQMPFSVRVFP